MVVVVSYSMRLFWRPQAHLQRRRAQSAITIADNGESMDFVYSGRGYSYNLLNSTLQQHAETPDDEYLSPDGNRAIFIRDHNLWLRDVISNELTQLTFDGVENYGYGTNNAGWLRDAGPVLLWSPDSSKIATFRHDGREVGEMYLYDTRVGHGELDAMGTPGRSKSFHDIYYGNMGDNGLPDQITAIRQLAAERPWMDLDRVGIWGHSGGGFASTAGLLRYPDFYKVAVSSAGNHDNRNYEDDWGEKWQGLLETYPESSSVTTDSGTPVPRTNYDNQANQLLVENLQGKLLLAHGLLDDNVHPSNTLLMVQALIKAEKDFDLLVLPDSRHGFGNSRYFMKRRWDYFVRHLKAVEPPADFRFATNIP